VLRLKGKIFVTLFESFIEIGSYLAISQHVV